MAEREPLKVPATPPRPNPRADARSAKAKRDESSVRPIAEMTPEGDAGNEVQLRDEPRASNDATPGDATPSASNDPTPRDDSPAESPAKADVEGSSPESAQSERPKDKTPPPLPSVPDRRELPAGTVISGRYVIEETLGRGGMGTVYAVRDRVSGEDLALKVLHPAFADNPATLERFRAEATAPVRIGTAHVVRIVEADVSAELGGLPFMVMERLEGRDLASELRLRGALPAGELCVYLAQVAETLDRAHAAGITHRDLKPGNLFVTHTPDGAPLVKILDFGIAKLADSNSFELTQDGCVFGTPWFMSPEQASGNSRTVGPAADRWALGLIAYRLLTGKSYWTAEGMAALIGQIVYDDMPPPSQTAPHLGIKFDAWFARACDRDPDLRFETAAEQIRELARALGVTTSGAEDSGSDDEPTMHVSDNMLEPDPTEPAPVDEPVGRRVPTPMPSSSVAPLAATRPPPRPASNVAIGQVTVAAAVALCIGAAASFFVLKGQQVLDAQPPSQAAAAPPAPPARLATEMPEPPVQAEPEPAPAPAEPSELPMQAAAPTAEAAISEASDAPPEPVATAAQATPVQARPAPKPRPTAVPYAPKVGDIKF